MDMRGFMKSMWMLSSIREKLIKNGVSAKDLEWVRFDDPDSLNKLAEKIMPWLLKNNPQVAQQIKESGLLQWQTKQDVVEIIDNI